ncbi:phytanoyl-CoA dioxygenase [Bradyrhizobium brasilense]|uniref:phytanoyl-CoA dioxygenase family protein n=1 Tax=Bradyrhizobium brasilense TaxID=1419277 RepID=UPI0014571514|nr:phytanoyl-CoA dioxygenase family protein [Bradyrhizobium brasilense]NLS75161.1 phytanoyl-CoA dioxygenase [Bradyrhizobium brasilense]
MTMKPPVRAVAVESNSEEAAMRAYCAEGGARALALDNRGPIRFTDNGDLAPEIREAYSRHGFYVFTSVVGTEELADLEADFLDIQSRLPVRRGAEVDAKGRPALGLEQGGRDFHWAKPLSDPFGGTKRAHGRYQVKMYEPKPGTDAPEETILMVQGSLQYSDACLRLYGHPQLLAVAAAINGPDFVPFNEALFIKAPGLGASVAWHQDGWTHWGSPDLDEDTHGFNFMAQLYGCTPANGLWVVPGSHRLGKVDIVAMRDAAGTDRLPQAVPLVCAAGDVVINNRQLVHGSFANTSPDWRVTMNAGFHRRSSVLGVGNYDTNWISKRSQVIGWGIDARRQRFPDETSFLYAAHAEAGQVFRWDDAARIAIRGYNQFDLSI